MKRSDKRGSHVEIIISFIIFVTFIFFLFSMIEPSIGTNKEKENVLDNIEASLTDLISADMTIITINVISSTSQKCIELNNEIDGLGINSRVVAIGSSGQSFNCSTSADLTDLRIERDSTADNFIKVYSSSAFSPVNASSSTCQNLQRGTGGYSLGLTKTSKYVFEGEMLKLMNEDCETLKDALDIPEEINFGYGLVLSNGTIIGTSEEELSTNIYIREESIKYVDLEGNILMGYLKIKIW
jgi:hypothetical protein